jgi:lauroyl/myristoyl acyltransferase
VVDLIRPIEHHLRRHLTSETNRQRFDRAKRFVDEAVRRGGDDEMAHRLNARWVKFLCSRASVQTDVWPEDADFLRHFATVFGLSPPERRKFIGLSLLGRLWRALYFDDLAKRPSEFVARLTRVTGSEHFDRCRRDGAGLILVPVHSQFARLFIPYLRHRGHDGLEVGLTNNKLEQKGLKTPVAKQFELARQMHAAKQLLTRGGIVFNPPDARQNLDNSRSVQFFGRQRRLATGFAELALKTGAHVVPVAYRFSPRGSFVLEFGAAFHVPGPESTHDERIDSLVGQYANFLRDEWRLYPWNIPWNHLLYYCLLPEADPGSLGEKTNAPRPSEARSGSAQPGFAG